MTDLYTVQCPYCGEPNELRVDPADSGQDYTEDCAVCCNPMAIHAYPAEDGGVERVEASRENP